MNENRLLLVGAGNFTHQDKRLLHREMPKRTDRSLDISSGFSEKKKAIKEASAQLRALRQEAASLRRERAVRPGKNNVNVKVKSFDPSNAVRPPVRLDGVRQQSDAHRWAPHEAPANPVAPDKFPVRWQIPASVDPSQGGQRTVMIPKQDGGYEELPIYRAVQQIRRTNEPNPFEEGEVVEMLNKYADPVRVFRVGPKAQVQVTPEQRQAELAKINEARSYPPDQWVFLPSSGINGYSYCYTGGKLYSYRSADRTFQVLDEMQSSWKPSKQPNIIRSDRKASRSETSSKERAPMTESSIENRIRRGLVGPDLVPGSPDYQETPYKGVDVHEKWVQDNYPLPALQNVSAENHLLQTQKNFGGNSVSWIPPMFYPIRINESLYWDRKETVTLGGEELPVFRRQGSAKVEGDVRGYVHQLYPPAREGQEWRNARRVFVAE